MSESNIATASGSMPRPAHAVRDTSKHCQDRSWITAALVLLTYLPLAATSAAENVPESSDESRRTFYVDSQNGRDGNNDGLSADKAWRSLERVNSAELKPGDTVRFKCGGLWRGSLNLQAADARRRSPTRPTVKVPSLSSWDRGHAAGRRTGSKSKTVIWATLPMEYRQGEELLDLRRSTWRHHQEAGAEVNAHA